MTVSAINLPGAARPAPDRALQDPVLASQQIFRQVLDALSNPGMLRPGMVHPGVSQDRFVGNQYLASVLLTLLDHEVSVHVAPAVVAGDDLETLLVRRTRVAIEPASVAAFVVADAAMVSPHLPAELRRGTLAYPDDGATLVLAMESFGEHESNGTCLHLTGPGIETSRTVKLPAEVEPDLFESRNQVVAQYPLGIDLLLIDRTGHMVGIPRTTTVRVQPEGGR